MEQFLSEYLFANKACPLPGLGELQFSSKSATFSQTEQTMIPPAPEVVFVRRNVEEHDLVEFIAKHAEVSVEHVSRELKSWCNELSNLADGEKFLKGVGSFYIDTSGRFQFRSQSLHSALLPEVSATRVIRKEASHQILVGDKESTSVQMTEYFQEQSAVKRKRWWIAAAVMGLVAAATITAYFVTSPRPGFSGNRQVIPALQPVETYSVPH